MLCITISKDPNSRSQGRRPCEGYNASKAEGRKLRRSRNFASALNPVDNYFRKISQVFLRSKWDSSLIWNLPLKFFWVIFRENVRDTCTEHSLEFFYFRHLEKILKIWADPRIEVQNLKNLSGPSNCFKFDTWKKIWKFERTLIRIGKW